MGRIVSAEKLDSFAIAQSRHLLEPGSAEIAIGAGCLGRTAIELLRTLSSATIIAVDTTLDKPETAERVGSVEGCSRAASWPY